MLLQVGFYTFFFFLFFRYCARVVECGSHFVCFNVVRTDGVHNDEHDKDDTTRLRQDGHVIRAQNKIVFERKFEIDSFGS